MSDSVIMSAVGAFKSRGYITRDTAAGPVVCVIGDYGDELFEIARARGVRLTAVAGESIWEGPYGVQYLIERDVKHYAFGVGMFGCLYAHVDGPYSTQQEAAEAAGNLYDLQPAGREALVRDAYLNMHEYNHAYIDMDVEERGGQCGDYIEVFEVDEHWAAD
jgi:hypothetical protein